MIAKSHAINHKEKFLTLFCFYVRVCEYYTNIKYFLSFYGSSTNVASITPSTYPYFSKAGKIWIEADKL